MWIGVEDRGACGDCDCDCDCDCKTSFLDKRSLRVLKSDREGVRPPEGREVQSSILEAPFWAARRADSGLKEAISRLAILTGVPRKVGGWKGALK